MMPTMRGTKKAIENTGPMKPTDCATASMRVSLRPEPPSVARSSVLVVSDIDPSSAARADSPQSRSNPNEFARE